MSHLLNDIRNQTSPSKMIELELDEKYKRIGLNLKVGDVTILNFLNS